MAMCHPTHVRDNFTYVEGSALITYDHNETFYFMSKPYLRQALHKAPKRAFLLINVDDEKTDLNEAIIKKR